MQQQQQALQKAGGLPAESSSGNGNSNKHSPPVDFLKGINEMGLIPDRVPKLMKLVDELKEKHKQHLSTWTSKWQPGLCYVGNAFSPDYGQITQQIEDVQKVWEGGQGNLQMLFNLFRAIYLNPNNLEEIKAYKENKIER
jgi:hypothetical protein